MILFCKEFGKVSLALLVGLQDFSRSARPYNDTMILFPVKKHSYVYILRLIIVNHKSVIRPFNI